MRAINSREASKRRNYAAMLRRASFLNRESPLERSVISGVHKEAVVVRSVRIFGRRGALRLLGLGFRTLPNDCAPTA